MSGGNAESLPVVGGVEGQVIGILSDFDTGSATLKPPHTRWLDTNVVPIIRGGGSMTVEGWASPLGSDATNTALSRQRASAVVAYVRREAGRTFEFLEATGTGEDRARDQHVREGSNPGFYRAALVTAWPLRHPPPVPPPTPRPVVLASRIIFRQWADIQTEPIQSTRPGIPGEDDPWVQAANYWIGRLYAWASGQLDDPPGRERRNARRTQQINQAYRVNTIEIRQTTQFRRDVLGGRIEATETDVDYRWGPPNPNVIVNTREIIDGVDVRRLERTRSRQVARAVADQSSFFNPSLL
ncbi:MAG: OmpA family protein [Planctomycetales bacterium]|nr:OmpA family protein [Planctomycetales bacterium]